MRTVLIVLILCLSSLGIAAVPEALLIRGALPVALTPSAQLFVDAETLFNPVEVRSNAPFWIPHLEIPLDALDHDRGLGLDRRIVRSLVFEKEGKKFVRWILNPEDTLYGQQLRKSLRERGIAFSEGSYFIGYLTSSRSCIVQDPKSSLIFSVKSSTNQTGGSWRDKKETVRAAKAGRLLSDYLTENASGDVDPDIGFVKEPLAFNFGPADQAMIIRQYDHFNSADGRRVVPLFAVLHEKFGQHLAELNGSRDPEKFWKARVGTAFGSVLSRFALGTGVMYNSPHGQNFLVELDANLKVTGHYFTRDYADAMLFAPILRAQGGQKVLAHFKSLERKSNGVHEDKLLVMYNPFHAVHEIHPTWVTDTSKWSAGFQARAAEVIRERLHLPEVDSTKLRYTPAYDYYWNQEVTGLKASASFAKYLGDLRARRSIKQGQLCSAVFKRLGTNQ